MGRLIYILTLFAFTPQQSEHLPLRDGRPTSRGIDFYVEHYGPEIIREYQAFTGDSLYGVEITALPSGELGADPDSELGYYYPHDVYVSRKEVFEAYELDMLDPERRRQLKDSNRFVKAIMIHELTHAYIFIIAREMRYIDSISVNPSFPMEIWTIHSHESYGSTFIEEGLCEYMSGEMGQIIVPEESCAPGSMEHLLIQETRSRIQYKYSVQFLEAYLDSTGFKTGAKILLHNPPPSLEELMDPPSYFARLVVPPQLVGN